MKKSGANEWHSSSWFIIKKLLFSRKKNSSNSKYFVTWDISFLSISSQVHVHVYKYGLESYTHYTITISIFAKRDLYNHVWFLTVRIKDKAGLLKSFKKLYSTIKTSIRKLLTSFKNIRMQVETTEIDFKVDLDNTALIEYNSISNRDIRDFKVDFVNIDFKVNVSSLPCRQHEEGFS